MTIMTTFKTFITISRYVQKNVFLGKINLSLFNWKKDCLSYQVKIIQIISNNSGKQDRILFRWK